MIMGTVGQTFGTGGRPVRRIDIVAHIESLIGVVKWQPFYLNGVKGKKCISNAVLSGKP